MENATTEKNQATVVVYLRVSTHKQGTDGNGIHAQERDINIFLDSHSDHKVIGRFIEVESGSNSARRELEKALKLCRDTNSILLVQKVDRLSRDVEFIAKLLKEKNLRIKVANLPNADNFQIHLFAALGQQEREFISQRTKSAMAAAKIRGAKFGNPNLSEMNRMRKIRARRNDDQNLKVIKPLREKGMTYQEIANTLNEMGVRTPQGCDFYASTVHRIVKRGW